MNTKLTLTLKEEVIKQAKKYAAEKGRSLSELVENYFILLTEDKKEPTPRLSKKTKKLRGILKVDQSFDYKKLLEDEVMKKYHG